MIHENFEESQKLIDALKENGLSDLDSERLERLLSFKCTPEEKTRWVKLGILDKKEEKILIDEDVTEDTFTIEVIIWSLVYTNQLIKTPDGYQNPKVHP
jgi:hypothetical protein